MLFKSYNPSVSLQPFIDEYVIICSDGNNDDPATDKFIPRLGEAMLFHFHNVPQILKDGVFIQFPKVFFLRQQKRYEYIEPGQDSDILIVRLKPGAIYRLFNISPLEFSFEFKDASLSYGNEVNTLYELMAEESNVDNRVHHIESFLTERLSSMVPLVKAEVVSKAIRLIMNSNGCIAVSEIGSILSVEVRSLRRYFHYQIGISVKSFIRLVKFNYIVFELIKNPTTQMLDIVTRFGYFDQTHFINDFKEIYGETPFTFLKKDKQNTKIISAIR
jgi:AraC-like DNA-binding protein